MVKNSSPRRVGDSLDFDNLSKRVIGLAIEVHRNLGPGLLESSYRECLAYELKENQIQFEKEKELPVIYKDVQIACGYRIDLLVENSLIIELKSVSSIIPIYEAQILTYMKLSNIAIGLLINFNVKVLKNGIKRYVL